MKEVYDAFFYTQKLKVLLLNVNQKEILKLTSKRRFFGVCFYIFGK